VRKQPWFGPRGGCVQLDKQMREQNVLDDETHPLYQEYVAREHLDGGMPVIELHRNHGVPLSAVRRWIATYRASGRAGIERAAKASRERAARAEARRIAKRPTAAELDRLREMIATRDFPTMRAAYQEIRRRKVIELAAEIVGVIGWVEATKQRDRSLQDELELLAAIGARHELHDLARSKLKVIRGYRPWFFRLLKEAGCPIETIEKPYTLRYQLDGTWFALQR
jgi:transposase-like protein